MKKKGDEKRQNKEELHKPAVQIKQSEENLHFSEEEFKKSEAKYRLLADNVTDVIFTIDMNFNYTFASPSVYNLVGYTADELTTMKVEQLVDSETLAGLLKCLPKNWR